LRKGFGLPTIEHQDAIYGYYFYRLIQRAKNITLIYNSNADGLQSGEMSRFIYQLKYESNFNIKEKSLRYDISSVIPEPILVAKSASILEKLNKYSISETEKIDYLSPSALTSYLKCKLRFYYRYIAGLEEKEVISEQIDAPMFGNILHQAMHALYKPYTSQIITAEILHAIAKNDNLMDDAIDSAFSTEYFKGISQKDFSGRNIIIRNLIEKYIRQIINVDIDFSPFEIVLLEKKLLITVPVKQGNKELKIRVGGKIDRIDKQNSQIRVIDYKSGADKLEFKGIEMLFTENAKDQNSAVFQTFLYSKFYTENNNVEFPVVPGIYSVRKLFEQKFDYRIQLNADKTKTLITDYRQINSKFSDYLNRLITEIFDPTVSFTQTEDSKNCLNCPYNQICSR
jgi:CRISPR/Cas system-associated exonuclease Cas4 (RecB family)